MCSDSSSSKSKVFRGDDDSLVDVLIAACHEHKAPSAPLPGFGRELQPYFDENEDVPLPSNCGRKPSSSSPKRNVPRAPARQDSKVSATHKAAGPARRAAAATANNTAASTIAVAGKASASNAVMSANAKGGSNKRGISPMTGSSPPACPGMFSSPNPQELPKPSSKLFKRATSPAPGQNSLLGAAAGCGPIIMPAASMSVYVRA